MVRINTGVRPFLDKFRKKISSLKERIFTVLQPSASNISLCLWNHKTNVQDINKSCWKLLMSKCSNRLGTCLEHVRTGIEILSGNCPTLEICCSANNQLLNNVVSFALLLMSKPLSCEIELSFWQTVAIMEGGFTGHRLWIKECYTFVSKPNQNLQLFLFSRSGFKRVQIWKKAMLFESPIKSNCVCKVYDVFFAFKVNSCRSRIIPSVQVWALHLLFSWTEYHRDVTMTLWSFNGTGRQIKIDEETLNLDTPSRTVHCFHSSYTVTFYDWNWDKNVKRFPLWMKHVTLPLPNQPSLVFHSDLHNMVVVYLNFLSMHPILIFSPVLERQSICDFFSLLIIIIDFKLQALYCVILKH